MCIKTTTVMTLLLATDTTHDDYNQSPGLCDSDREGSNSFMTFKSLPTDKTTAPSKSARNALPDPDHLAKAPAL